MTLCGTTSCSALQQCVVIDGKETCVEKGLVSIAGTETQDANDAGSEDTSSGLDSGSEDQSGLDTVGSEDFVSVDVEVDALAPLGLDCGTLGDGKFVVGQEKTLTMTIANASGTVTLTQVDPALPQDLTATVNGGSIDVGKLCKAP